MADEHVLSEIRDEARLIRAGYREAIVRRLQYTAAASAFQEPVGNDTWRDANYAANEWMRIGREYHDRLERLLKLVYQHLPDEGRSFQQLSRLDAAEVWDWDAAEAELQGIEVEAFKHTTESGSESSAKEKRGSKKSQTRKLDVAIALKLRNPEWSDAEVARKAGCDPAYLSRNEEYRRNADMVDNSLVRMRNVAKYDQRSGERHPVDEHDHEREVDERIDKS